MDHRNRKWIVSENRHEYLSGVSDFLNFAFSKDKDGKVPCPCTKCLNRFILDRVHMYDHLVINRMMGDYNVWYCHGESLSNKVSEINTNTFYGFGDGNENIDGGCNEDTMRLLSDVIRASNFTQNVGESNNVQENINTVNDYQDGLEGPNIVAAQVETEKYNIFVKDVDTELYPGCKKFNRLSFLLQLYNVKCRFGWSNTSFTVLIKLLKEAFPEGETLPNSFNECKKIVDGLGLSYVNIDACPNDCMLFWKEQSKSQECGICHASRWKIDANKHDGSNSVPTKKRKNKIPAKVLRYFPLGQRLQRMYMSPELANDMKWHVMERTKDNILRHPADAEAWSSFDDKYPQFALEPRNVRLGLASDGFNPFGRLDSTYSIWPVILIPYNLPPWLCMKKENFILSLIIPGPKSPGNSIDVYLQPLVEELVDLWENGIPTFDSSTEEVFQMRASLSWTINDYPALGNLSGWNIHSKFGCVSCNTSYCAKRLKHGQKFCYMDHQRFIDDVTKLKPPSGSELLEQLRDIHFTLGKLSDPPTGMIDGTWKKKSIFFKLPYWEFNLVRHNLDVMHIEKNVCENIIYTLLNVDKKSKDNLSARKDLKLLGIRKKLWPQPRGRKTFLPPGPYCLSKQGKKCFLEVLKRVKFPDGYASNISRCIHKNNTLCGLKSHDCHVLMQCLLPVAFRGNLDDKVTSTLIELCTIFRVLCGKTLHINELDLLEAKAAKILCSLEKIFLPSFFTVSVHLVSHLIREARISGPVHYRWMYLKTLKSYVRNQARPEGSIAKAYLADECLIFCSRYIKGVQPSSDTRNTTDNMSVNSDEEGSCLFPSEGRPYGSIIGFRMEEKMWKQAHRYVLFNCDDTNLNSLKKDHMAHISRTARRRRPSQREKERLHSEGFSEWLRDYVNDPSNEADHRLTRDIKTLARGPNFIGRRFHAFDVKNGFRFRSKWYEQNMTTQNSGLMVIAKTQSYASSSDSRPMLGDVTYFGRVTGIFELDYYGDLKVVLLECEWVDVVSGRGIKTDKLGCTLVNFQHLIHAGDRLSDDPFVFPSQVQQVIFVEDGIEPQWCVPIPMKRRDTFDIGDDDYQDVGLFMNNNSEVVDLEVDIDVEIDESSTSNFEGLYVNDEQMGDVDDENENALN